MRYRRLRNGNYVCRIGGYYIFIRKRRHYKMEGFDNFWIHYSAFIKTDGEYMACEGVFGTSINTIKKAKKWVQKTLKDLEQKKQNQ